MIAVVAALVALACVAASARRVWFAANPTWLEPETFLAEVARSKVNPLEALRDLVAKAPEAEWERELLEAMSVTSPEQRAALVNEQLTELDYRIQRWARVPRVCASVATSVGFLLATLVLRRGLTEAGELPTDAGDLLVRGLVGDALTVAALGVVGTAFCIAAQTQAKRLATSRTKAADKLVERLERAAEELASTAVPQG
ncbi:hypothetical protein AKJ09_08393 [Labilithrix luteola]|uniref:MotA/TolQ/ExbB proton channel domain-containing protein n=1 Tax=Labilithrix luteola TaxID=1391654 RepID=A0A0K1Q8L9_9BACT|nr:hypothetical protein [Labilithrix luteola]AKV01730.1 hypothetical protein AKJ09_08393 [Labilithrix luteola]